MFTWGPVNRETGEHPYFGDVVLLMHMDGTNGGTSFIDSSGYSHTMTAADAVMNTSEKVFGSAGADFTANNNARITSPTSSVFKIIGDVAIEFRLKMTSVASGIYVFAISGGAFLWIYTPSAGNLNCYFLGGDFPESAAISANTWYDVKIIRSGTVTEFYVDGTLISTLSPSEGEMFSDATVEIGSAPSLAGNNAGGRCYIDELRITVGSSRPSSVASEAFPDN